MINYYVFLYGSGCSYSDHTTIIEQLEKGKEQESSK